MNLLKSSLARIAVLSLAGITLTTSSLHAQSAPQTVNLVTGWNAVWLEVEPVDAEGLRKAPEDVFTDSAIEKVITPKPRSYSARQLKLWSSFTWRSSATTKEWLAAS